MNPFSPKLIAQTGMQEIFGTISPPPGSMAFPAGHPEVAIGNLLGFLIALIMLVAGLATLIFLLWGAFDWITSAGQKEKIEKAQNKMVNAIVGLLLVIVAFTVFNFLMCTVLAGKFGGIGCGFSIKLPHL